MIPGGDKPASGGRTLDVQAPFAGSWRVSLVEKAVFKLTYWQYGVRCCDLKKVKLKSMT